MRTSLRVSCRAITDLTRNDHFGKRFCPGIFRQSRNRPALSRRELSLHSNSIGCGNGYLTKIYFVIFKTKYTRTQTEIIHVYNQRTKEPESLWTELKEQMMGFLSPAGVKEEHTASLALCLSIHKRRPHMPLHNAWHSGSQTRTSTYCSETKSVVLLFPDEDPFCLGQSCPEKSVYSASRFCELTTLVSIRLKTYVTDLKLHGSI